MKTAAPAAMVDDVARHAPEVAESLIDALRRTNPRAAEAVATAGEPALAALAAGSGIGLIGGTIENKDLDETARDLGRGALAGVIGGGTIGYALDRFRPLLKSISQTTGGGLGGMLARAPIGAASSVADFLSPRLGGPLGMALLSAGLFGGLGGALGGSGVEGDRRRSSLVHDVVLEQAKISEDHQMSKRANVFDQLNTMPDGALMSMNREMPQSFDFDPPARSSQLRNMAKQQFSAQNKQELERRRQLAMQIGSPIGGFVGKGLGNIVSSIAGERRAPGLRGLLGFKEDRIDRDKAQEVGQLMGNIGGGILSGHIAERLQRNPDMDAYMDELGL